MNKNGMALLDRLLHQRVLRRWRRAARQAEDAELSTLRALRHADGGLARFHGGGRGIDGRLDTLGDGRTQLGLTILADFFKTEGWVWGAAFGREDSMHFEISRKQLDEWIANGDL